jgi:hypothetical protein
MSAMAYAGEFEPAPLVPVAVAAVAVALPVEEPVALAVAELVPVVLLSINIYLTTRA